MFALNTPRQAFSNQREEELLEQSGGEKAEEGKLSVVLLCLAQWSLFL